MGAASTRIPPHDLQAEESLLGAMMLDPEAIVAVNGLMSNDFYKPAHAHIFEAIRSVYAEGRPAEPVTVADELRRAGLLDQVGGHGALVQIMSSTPAPSNAASYAGIVTEKAVARRFVAAAGEVADAAYRGDLGEVRRLIADAGIYAAEYTSTRVPAFVDWAEFWSLDPPGEDFLIDGVIARGRGHAIYASHKEGKSLYLLWCATRLAQHHDLDVVYLDYEMTRADVLERLDDMGHGPDSDFSRLHYMFAPDLAPLDTREGADDLRARVDEVRGPDRHLVVFIDTYGRAVEGEENSNDTTRAFYRWTGSLLRRLDATWVRLDHAGKDTSKGQRGGSAKGDDVDVVWKLTATDTGIKLHRDVARMSWVPENVAYTMTSAPLDYVATNLVAPAGTAALADDLDRLGVPLDATTRDAVDILRAAGIAKRRQVVVAAMKWRRTKDGNQPGTTLYDATPEPAPEPAGTETLEPTP